MKYRPEIDGLRAVAVLSVFLFHLGIKSFSGGFIGVDVFFVISGYLITGILQKDLDKNSFSIITFYDRRIRRIFPALYLMLLATFAAGYVLMMTNAFQAFCKSLVSSLLFYSNFQFWRESGYFDLDSELKPLLHTWSLSIEEQFYIFFPTLLYLLHRYFSKYKKIIIAICFWVSFAGCIFLTRKNALVAFYFSPVRAWELLLGSMLAIGAFPLIKSKAVRQIGSLVGLILVVYSIFRFSANTSFPGYRALIPCLGTALLIHCTGNRDGLTWMDRFLSVKPMVWVGKISYSLYLWHWPAIVFTKYAMGNQYGWVQQSWIVAIAFFAAYLSWKYVEQPFRVKDGRFKDLKSVLKPLGVVTALLLFISISGGFLTRGFPHRFSPAVVQYSNGSLDRNPDREHCHAIPLERIQSNDLCGMGVKKDGAPDFIVWGDSFADAMMPVFKKMAEEKGLYGLFASTSACAPIVGVNRKVKGLKLKCAAFNDAVMKVIHDFEIKNVVLVSGWAMSGYKSVNSANTQTELNLKFKKNRTTDVKNFYFGFDQTLSDLDKIGSKVWVVGMIPRPGFDIPDLLAKYEIKGIDRRHLEVGKGKYDWQSKGFNEVLTELAKKHSFELIDPTSILCPNNCIVEKDGRSLYYDKQHLSAYGARLIEPTLEPLLVSLNKH